MSSLSSLQPSASVSQLDIGVQHQDRRDLANALCNGLADTFTLHFKTLSFHWNAVGPHFYSLHQLTEAQYTDLNAAMDQIAERVRALGFVAPHSAGLLLRASTLEEAHADMSGEEMVQELLDDNERCAKSLRDAVAIAEQAEDMKTADLLTNRVGVHEESAWMLRSMLGQ